MSRENRYLPSLRDRSGVWAPWFRAYGVYVCSGFSFIQDPGWIWIHTFFLGGEGWHLIGSSGIVKFVFLQPLLTHDLAIPHYLLAHAGVIDMGAELQSSINPCGYLPMYTIYI